MRILMVNKFLYPNGGSETYMMKLGEELEHSGHQVQYFGMYDEKNTVGNASGAYVVNVDYHGKTTGVLKKINMGIETIYSRNARKEIRKVLDNFKPDIVHLNNINFQITPSIVYEIKKYGIPMIQTVHDVQIACPCHRFYIEHREKICEACKNGKFYRCVVNKCVHNSIAKSALAAMESYYYHTRDTYNLVDLYICPSHFIKSKIVQSGVKQEKIKVIYNFADQIGHDTLQTDNRSKYALYFGRLSKEKGILTLLDVCKELSSIQFVIAGRGPLEKLVEKRCETLQNVEYVGFKTGKELQQLIFDAVFSIYPSEWYENCPLSVIESQVLGTPVIGSDLGGTKELIKNGETGLIFEGYHPEELKKAIQILWSNDELIEQMSSKCRNVDQMDLEDYTRHIIELYRAMIEGKKA
ncbi:MAG: glycosyltransferase family 4 protein [Dorea sp.]